MRKEFNMMLIVVVCAVLGVVTAAILGQLYLEGIFIDSLVGADISLMDLQFLTFFAWLIVGVVVGVMKD